MFLRPYFEAADEDGNQTLDVGELVTMLRSLLTDLAVPQTILSEVEASADAILKAMDADGDERVDFPEVVDFLIRGGGGNGPPAAAAAAAAVAAAASRRLGSGQWEWHGKKRTRKRTRGRNKWLPRQARGAAAG